MPPASSPTSSQRLVAGAVLLAMVGAAAGCATGSPATWTAPGTASSASPSPRGSVTAPGRAAAGSPAASPAPARQASRYVFPVSGLASYAHVHHDYPASDMMAACGLPVLAATDGVVAELSRVDRFDPRHPKGEDKGGIFVSIIGDDGVRYYGAHLSAIENSITPGVRVEAGTRIGRVGSTGNSGACHLHFAISPPCARTGDWWTRRGAIWPWPYLDAWRSGKALSPAAEVAAWQSKSGCPASAPNY